MIILSAIVVLSSPVLAALPAAAQTPADENWDRRFGYIYSAGLGFATNERLVVYVNEPCIDAEGNVLTCNIGSWDGSGWRLEGPGHFNGTVRAITIGMSGNDVYLGGDFITLDGFSMNRIAVWQGSEWQPLGAGLNEPVSALRAHETGLYAGGSFTEAGGDPANFVARWTGVSWQPLVDAFGANGVNAMVRAITSSPAALWMTGNFTSAGSVAGTTRIARWDIGSQTWQALGNGLFGFFGYDVEHAAGQLVAISNDLLGPRSYDFQTEVWETLPSPVTASVIDVHIANSGLVYGRGSFPMGAGQAAASFGVWDGNAWEAVGTGLFDARDFITGVGEDVYVGGLSLLDGGRVHGIGWWNGSEWSSLGQGLGTTFDLAGPGSVYALARSGTHLYAAGTFRWAGSQAARGVARWDGSRWAPIGGPDADVDVRSIVPYGSGVVAGGMFTSVEGMQVNGIARWDGDTWHAMGTGATGGHPFYGAGVHTLYRDGNDVYAGGSFTEIDGVAATQIARWDGSAWHALGSGLAQVGVVNAIIRFEGSLFVGGQFQVLGDGTTVQSVAVWDGNVWAPASAGIGAGYVRAFAIRTGQLFAIHDGSPATLLRWTGTSWEQVAEFTRSGPAQFLPRLFSLHANGADLYVGGDFTHVNGQRAWRVAKWDGANWQSLGSGLRQGRAFVGDPGGVYAFSGSEDGLWLGGSFQFAGNTPSNNIALWRDFAWVPTSSERGTVLPEGFALHTNYPNPFNPSTTIRLDVPVDAHVVLTVYDVLGREVATIVDGAVRAGRHSVDFDASALGSGVYVYRMRTLGFEAVRKMIVVK